MKFFILSAVLAACVVSSLGGFINSMGPPKTNVCCPCPENTNHRCLDKTACTPYCGYGECNIFGCNCDNGCRLLPDIKPKQQSLESSIPYLEAGEASDIFDITDANKDGIITIEEWLESPVRSTSGGETCSMLVKQWARFDPTNVGYLTKHQAINRKM